MSEPTTTPEATEPQAARAPVEGTESAPETATPDLGDGGKKALDAERRARRQAEKAATDAAARIKEYEDRDKTESQKLTEQLAALKAEAATAKAEALRLRVAAELGLPGDLHEFLTGDDEESVRAKAQKLMAATAAATGPRQPAPDLTQGAKQGGTGTDQLSRADLARMTPQEIVAAQEAGRFNDLMAGRQ